MAIVRKKIGILGGGIAGLSLADFLHEPDIAILEKEKKVGGLCRSYSAGGVTYDIGPHIMFSKNQKVLDYMTTITPTNRMKRSNLIFLNGKYITYPFENFLGQLKDKEAIAYCLSSFLHNPYKDMPAENMLAFFLKTFGEGITRTYLQPYNEKIWKFDPSMLDTQMVGRIPRPPDEDIINSAKGKYSEGYLHQLFFHYPKKGGYQSMIDAVKKKIEKKGVEIYAESGASAVVKKGGQWSVKTPTGEFLFDRIISCMPIHELMRILPSVPEDIMSAVNRLLYNSIYIVIVNVKKENVGKHFAFNVPQKDVIFHRMSKLDFMGRHYHKPGSSTFMLEVTFREHDRYDTMTPKQIIERCVSDMARVGFIDSKKEVNFTDIRKEKYAYVMYTLNHRKDTDSVLSYLRSNGIESCGRFAEFEYMNSDKVIEHAMALAEKLNRL
ncbi:MAG: FAD-dependent oxidoreductase [bacterium]|nr:FAD-dependent oxidoreductase [bacterium]